MRGVLLISNTNLSNYFGGLQMEEEMTRVEQRKSRNAAIAMVALMLLSSQMYSFQNFEQDDPEESVWGPVAQRTAYQQMNQAAGPVAGEGQNQPAASFDYSQVAFTDLMYNLSLIHI